MLSDTDLKQAIESGWLKIEPLESSLLKPAGIGLRLGRKVFVEIERGIIDPLDQDSMDCYIESGLDEGESFVIEPRHFALAQTYERVGLSKSFGAFIDGTSTVARLGISVTQTSTVIEPGHGWPTPQPITLELANNGVNPVRLHYKMRIATLVLFRLEQRASRGYTEIGKYSDGAIRPKRARHPHSPSDGI